MLPLPDLVSFSYNSYGFLKIELFERVVDSYAAERERAHTEGAGAHWERVNRRGK